MLDEQTLPELNPPSGGRWLRDPRTGALTPFPDEPPAPPAPEKE
jgi:hypothetical protein